MKQGRFFLSPTERLGGYSDEPGICPSISCPLYNLKTVGNNLMILDNYVDQVMTMCHV